MITEQYKDKVYFSKLLCTDCPNIYKDICEILDANNVAHCLVLNKLTLY